METISLRKIFSAKRPDIFTSYPEIVINLFIFLLEKILKLKRINMFLTRHNDKKNIEFIDELFEDLDFTFSISNKDIQKIPTEGKLICVSNHPLGALDGLVILKALIEIRKDVKIVANDVLLNIDNLKDLFLPYDIGTKRLQKENIKAISTALVNEECVIFFPSAEVSRLKWLNIKDGEWHKGALHFARKHQVPVLPIFIKAKNSCLFYLVSIISRKLSALLLPSELFKKESKSILVKIGEPIPSRSFSNNSINLKVETNLLRKHVYQIGKNKRGIFITEKNIIAPINRKIIKREALDSILLGFTSDDKKILLTTNEKSPNIIKEIARLREVTFRKVGEGSGKKLDLDEYDKYYKHIYIWDDQDLEIVGAYRIGLCPEIISTMKAEALYTNSLFRYSPEFESQFLDSSIELGRSFIQKKYWNSYALDYLWQGIGAYLNLNPSIKYLFGAVSISNTYPEEAKNLIVYVYRKWFGEKFSMVKSRNSFIISSMNEKRIEEIFDSLTYKDDLKKLKMILKQYAFTVPVLFKQYCELCHENGVKFLDFGIDESFEKCVDGLILVDISKIKEEKKERYMLRSQGIKNIFDVANVA